MKCLKMRIWILSLMAALFAEMSELATAQANKPPNDDFADRIVLEGILVTTNGSNLHATAESGEPSHSGLRARRSVWWSWTAPDSGTVELTTAGSDFDTVLAVYTGASLQWLTLVAENDDRAGGLTSRVLFSATDGTTYQIAVDGNLADSGSILLNLRGGLPPNDFLESATPLIGSSVIAYGNNTNATAEPGEPQHAGLGGGKSVWWDWTAPYSGIVEITTVGSDFDTLLAIYKGATFPSLTLVAANDDWNGSASSRVRFAAVPGQSYQIAVDGKPGSFGNIVLNLRMLTPPNDLFLNATPLIGRSAWVYGTNTDATAEAGEPQHAGVVSTNSVWWIWTAPYSFDVEIETDFFFGNGPEFDTVLAVYVGEAVSSLSLIAANDDWNGKTTSHVSFKAIAGTTYHIAVAGKVRRLRQQFTKPRDVQEAMKDSIGLRIVTHNVAEAVNPAGERLPGRCNTT